MAVKPLLGALGPAVEAQEVGQIARGALGWMSPVVGKEGGWQSPRRRRSREAMFLR